MLITLSVNVAFKLLLVFNLRKPYYVVQVVVIFNLECLVCLTH